MDTGTQVNRKWPPTHTFTDTRPDPSLPPPHPEDLIGDQVGPQMGTSVRG